MAEVTESTDDLGSERGPSAASALDVEGRLDDAALNEVQSALVAVGDYEELERTYALAAERAPSPERGRELWLSAGLLCIERLDAADRAEEYFQRVLASDPTELEALESLVRITEGAGRFEEAAEFLERAIDAVAEADRPDMLCHLAQLASERLEAPDRALSSLRYAYELAPDRLEVLQEARRIFVREGRFGEAKAVLDDEAAARGVGTDATDAAMGQAYRMLGVAMLDVAVQHPLAKECLERARSLGDEAALSKLDELAHIENEWEACAGALREAGFEAPNKGRAAELYLSAAQLYFQYGQDALKTDEYLDRCLILAPGHMPAVRFVEAMHKDDEQQLLRRLNQIAMGVKGASDKAEILLRLAELLESRLDPEIEPDEAAIEEIVNAYRRALAQAPGHREAAGRLSTLLESLGRTEERAQLLESHIAALQEGHAKVATHLELGRLYAERLGDSARSRNHFEAVVGIVPRHFEASAALRALYLDGGQEPLLLGVLDVLVENSPDLASRQAVLQEMAEVAVRVGREETFAALRRVFELTPADEEVRARLEALAAELGRDDGLAQAYLRAAERRRPGPGARDLYLAAGRIFDERLPRPKDAVSAYRRALAIDPENQEAHDALERLLREQNDPAALIEMLRAQMKREDDDAGRALALAKIADVQERELGDFDAATRSFSEVLELNPDNATALERLDGLYGRTQRFDEQASIVGRRIARAQDDDTRRELSRRRGRILLEELQKPDDAASMYLDALGPQPHGEVVTALVRLADSGVRGTEIALSLEPLFAKRGEADRQLAMLEILAHAGEDAEMRLEARRRASFLAEERLSDTDRALTLVADVLELAPDDSEAGDRLLRLSRELGAPERAADTLGRLLARSDLTPVARSHLAARLGGLMETDLDDRSGAIAAYRSALDADGANASAVAALERLLGAEDRQQEMAEFLESRLGATSEVDAQVQLGLALGQLRETRLNDDDGAIEAYRKVLEVAPREVAALSRLAAVLERGNRPAELVTALDRLRDASDDNTLKAQSEAKAADVERMRLGQNEPALARYARVLELDPTHAGAVAGLEALLEQDALRGDAGRLLEPVYAQTDRPRDRVRALEAQLFAATDEDRRKALMLDLADSLASLDEPEAAFSALARAFAEDLLGAHEEARLFALAERARKAPELAGLLEAKRERNPDDNELLRTLARLYDGHAAQPDRAGRAYRALLDKVPEDAEALEALERLTAAGDDPAALGQVLEQRAAAAETDADRVAFYKRAAGIYEEAADDPAMARASLERARDVDPEDRSVWQELARLYEAEGNTEALAEALARQADLVTDANTRSQVLLRLAVVEEGRERHADAIAAYKRILTDLPHQQDARQALERQLNGNEAKAASLALEPVYRASGDWSHLVDVYEILAESAEDSAERVERLLAIQNIHEERLDDAERAFSASTRAFREAPDRAELLDHLERLGKKAGQLQELLGVLEDQAEALPYVSEERADLRLRLASMAETVLSDRNRAVEEYKRILEERPDHRQALDELDRLYAELNLPRERVDILRKQAGIQEDPQEQTDRLRRAAVILEQELGDRTQAAHLYEQILMLDENDAVSLSHLDRLYAQTREHTELARVLERRAHETQGADRADLLLRLGTLRATTLSDPEGALTAYEGVLDIQAETGGSYDAALIALDDLQHGVESTSPELSARIAQLLEPHWIARGDAPKVVASKEARLAVAKEASEKKEILLEIGTLYEEALSQPEMAFVALTRAFSLAPEDRDLGRRLEALAEEADTKEELADLFAQVLPQVEDPDLQLDLSRRTADLYDRVLGRGEAAVPFYDRILKQVPHDTSALAALERIHRRTGDANALVHVLRGLEEGADDVTAKKGLLLQIAELSENELQSPDHAFQAYRRMLELDPSDRTVLRRMAALCERSDRVEDLAVVLAKQADATSDSDERAQVLLRLATLQREGMEDPVGAVETYAQTLELRPKDPGAVAGLSAILRGGGGGRFEAAEVLAPVYQSTGAYEDYVGCLEVMVDHERQDKKKKAFLTEIAEIYESRLGRPEHAFTYAQRALHLDLEDTELVARVERLARENGMLEELTAFYLDEAESQRHAPSALAVRRRVAHLYDHELKDRDKAIAEYGRVLDAAPGDPSALEALERLYRDVGSFQQLGEVYRRRIAQAEESEARIRLMREFARLQSGPLEDVPGAIATLRRLLDAEPDDVEALSRLAQLCKLQGRDSELADVLVRLIETTEAGTPARLEAQLELARLRAGPLGDLASAQSLLTDILSADASHPGARDFLQERFEDAVAEEDGALAKRYGEMLSEALRATGDHQELIAVLRVRAQMLSQANERAPLLEEVARLYEGELEQPELSFAAWAQVVREVPGRTEPRAELDRLAEALDLWEELVDVLEEVHEKAPDREAGEEIERRIAQVVHAHLSDDERSAASWQRVLQSKPDDPEALESMDGLAQSLKRWAALSEVLEKRVELAEGDEAKHPFYARLGHLWDERLSEPAEAIEWFRKARATSPRDKDVLGSLARLLSEEDNAAELFAVLEVSTEMTDDPREQVRLLSRLGQLAAEHLGRGKDAVGLYRRVLELDDENVNAQRALEELYEAQSRWQELATHLEGQLEEARDEKEVLRLQRKLGLIKGTRLGSIDEAVQSWTEILKRNPNDVEALSALREIYRGAERWEDLVATLRKLIPLQTSAEGVKEIRFELAEVFLSKLDQRDEAIESAKRVLDVEPHTPGELMRLEEIFETTGAFGETVRVMNLRADESKTRGEKIEIFFEIAKIYEEKIHRRTGAANAYEKILDLEPTSHKAYDALAEVYEKNGDYRKLVELINRRLEVTEQAESRRDLLFQIIDIQERWLGVPELAFTAACRAFAEEGADEQAQNVAERLAEETDNWEILAEVYLEQIDQVSVARGIDLRKRLAEIYAKHLDDAEEAETQLELVLASRVEDEDARDALLALYEAEGRHAEVVSQLQERVDLSTDGDEKVSLFFRMARLQEEKMEEPERAISSLKRILDIEPKNLEALDELARIFEAGEKWHPLLNILERRREATDDESEQVSLQMRRADVWEKGLGDVDQAIDAYREVLEVSAAHEGALEALERLYTRAERWMELIEVYERQVRITHEEGQAIEVLTRIATIWEERFRDLDSATETLIRVLEVNPEHLPTIKSLEDLWRRTEDWDKLVEAYDRHLELDIEPREQLRLHLAMGEVEFKHRNKVDAAEAAFMRALEKDPDSKEAVHSLGRLHEQSGNWFNAVEMLAREATLLGADPAAVEVHHRLGKIQLEMLQDRDAAKEAFNKALDLDPGYSPSLRSLRVVHEQDEEPEAVIRLLAQEAEHTDDRDERAELFAVAADLSLDHFDDVDQAKRYYLKGLEADPNHLDALRVLSDLQFGDEEWTEAEEHLVRLVDNLDRTRDGEELGRQYYRLGYIAEKLQEDDKALERYLASYELDATYLPTLEGLAEALLRAERHGDALRVFQTILIQHKASLTDAEVVDIHFQVGELSATLGETDRAQKSFSRALELDREHPPTLNAAARLAEELGDWEDAYDLRERLIQTLDGDERFSALVEQAVLCEQKIEEPYRAIDAYQEARRIRPDDLEVIGALARLYRQTSQTPQAVEALNDLGMLLTNPKAQADTFQALAEIHYVEENNAEGAVAALNNALDLEPNRVAAFSRIEEILYEQRMWRALEVNYHAMIKRMPKENVKARLVLWKSLGDLYAKVLKDNDGARVAYEVIVHRLDPADLQAAMTLAELYAADRTTAPKALPLYHKVLETAEDPALPARRLFELYWALGDHERAFCALSALVLMRAASDDERRAQQMLLQRAPQWPTGRLSDDLWRRHVLHPDCRNSLAEICSVVYRGAPGLFAEEQRRLTLNKRKERVDLDARGRNARVKLRYFDVYKNVHRFLAVPAVEHYHRAETGQPPRLYPGESPVLFAGQNHQAFRTMHPRLIAWTMTRQLACARPELAVVRALGAPDEVGAVMEAAIRLYVREGSGVDVGLDPNRVEAWLALLDRHLSDPAKAALRAPVAACLEKRHMRRLSRFLEGVEHTASRAALLAAQDVLAAAEGLERSDQLVDVSSRARVRALMLYTLSPDHFELRKRLKSSLSDPSATSKGAPARS